MKYLRNSIFILFAFLCFFNPLKAEAAERNFWNHLTYASFILDESTGYNHDDAWCQIDSITCDDWGLYLVRNGKDLDAFVVSPEPFTATYRRWSYTDPVVTKASQYGSVYYLMIMGGAFSNASYYTTTYPVFNGSYEDLLISIQNNQFGNFDNLPDVEEFYSLELGYLIGMDKSLSIVSYLSGQYGSYVDVSNSQEISFSWNPITSSGFNLFKNDYVDLNIRVTPEVKVSFTDFRGKNLGSYDKSFDTIEVNPTKLSFTWESSPLLDFVDEVQPSPASRPDIWVYFDVQLIGSKVGIINKGGISSICISYPDGFWSDSAHVTLFGEDLTDLGFSSPFGAGVHRDKSITVYDNREERPADPDIPEIHHTGFGDVDLTDLDLSDFMSTLNSTIEYVLVIPQVISSILSFLPSWVTALFSISFSLVAILIIYKLVRG